MLKTIDEQSANIIGGIIDRPHHFGSAFSAHPLARRRKERSCDIAIVDALEQTEAANVRLMKRIIIRIIARHDSPNDFAVSPGQEQGGVAVFVKRVSLAIEECFALENQRRHPGGIISVNPPRKLDKGIAIPARADF